MQLHGERPLVALDQIEIGRRNAQPLGHRRLGQSLADADAADARSREYLLFGHRALTTIYKGDAGTAQRRIIYRIYNFTTGAVKSQDRITLIFRQRSDFLALCALQCK